MATGPKLLALILSLAVSCPWAGAATPVSSSAMAARLSETHGTVFKRGFIDWQKDEWADPEPARVGDNLDEGMQVGTGDKSWAEVTWPTVTTRAWANSVFAIAPNQRLVYLLGGQMLFNLDKHRKDKKDFFVWTKVLQARIRGTTVMVQCTRDVSRITVLEGVVEVMNRLDKSVIRVNPGVVYEIKTPGTNPLPPVSQAPEPKASTPVASLTEDIVETTDETANEQVPLKLTDKPIARAPDISQNIKDAVFHNSTEAIENASYDGGVKVKPKLALAEMQEMAMPGEAPLMVFADAKAETRLFPANPDNLMSHPLVHGFNVRLPSLALVQGALTGLRNHESPIANANTNVYNPNPSVNFPTINWENDTIVGTVDSRVTAEVAFVHNAEILKVPMSDQYLVGPGVGYVLPLPAQAFNGYLPIGVLNGNTENMASSLTSSNLRPNPPVNNLPMNASVPRGPATNIPMNIPQTGTFVPPATANMPPMTNFVPSTTTMPTVTSFVRPEVNIPQVTNFVPPTTNIPTVTNFVSPTVTVPQMTNFVPPTVNIPQITNFVPPTTTMPTVNTFVPPAATNASVTTSTVNYTGGSQSTSPITLPTGSYSIPH